jgi:hypothetical protein
MGFLIDHRHRPIRVLIIAAAPREAVCDMSRFRTGEVYEVGPRVAEYLVGSGRAIIEHRRIPRRESRYQR